MRKPTPSTFILILLLLLYNSPCSSQSFLAGAESFLHQPVPGKRGIYRDTEGNEIDPYALFAQKGAKIIRIRLWHTPLENITDHCGNPVSTDNLNDVVLAFQRAKAQGMQLMLAIHYGDYFPAIPIARKDRQHGMDCRIPYCLTQSTITPMPF